MDDNPVNSTPLGNSRFKVDATPTYKGYRLQALYTLSHLLRPDADAKAVFRPEGWEDLDVLIDGALVETIQVKSSENLSLSDLVSTDKAGRGQVRSFLHR